MSHEANTDLEGKVSGQPVAWRVTQFPYPWTPKKQPGFQYSSDARFSRGGRFQASATLEKEDATDEAGSVTLRLDPTVEATAEPRTYAVEATVTGPDDQTVTAPRSFPVLPPFVLGVKAPRFLPRARSIEPQVVVLGPDGEALEDKAVTVRLLRREWHSTLRASDVSDGLARYTTDVVDVKLKEETLKSGKQPIAVPLAIDRSGVYVVEAEGRDSLRRSQVVSVDLYAMFDIDNFKKINDTHGHRAGDMILREFAQLVREHTRKSDIFARYGGEEFIMLLPQTSLPGSCAEAERLSEIVRKHKFYAFKDSEKITVSIGIACSSDAGIRNPDNLITFADNALFTAKKKGRDQIAICPSS